MSKLVITEKPSVAQTIAAVLGVNIRKDGYLEGGYIVSWCVGHLAELASAEAYDPQYAKWQLDDLPILPDNWRYTIPHNKQKRFSVLQSLMDREDVTESKMSYFCCGQPFYSRGNRARYCPLCRRIRELELNRERVRCHRGSM